MPVGFPGDSSLVVSEVRVGGGNASSSEGVLSFYTRRVRDYTGESEGGREGGREGLLHCSVAWQDGSLVLGCCSQSSFITICIQQSQQTPQTALAVTGWGVLSSNQETDCFTYRDRISQNCAGLASGNIVTVQIGLA